MKFKEFVEKTKENYDIVEEPKVLMVIDGGVEKREGTDPLTQVQESINDMPKDLASFVVEQGDYRNQINGVSSMPGILVSWKAWFAGASIAWNVLKQTYGADIEVNQEHVDQYLFSQLQTPLKQLDSDQGISASEMSANMYFADRDKEGLEALTDEKGVFGPFDFDPVGIKSEDSRVIIGGYAASSREDGLVFRVFKDTNNAELINGYLAVMRIAYNAIESDIIKNEESAGPVLD